MRGTVLLTRLVKAPISCSGHRPPAAGCGSGLDSARPCGQESFHNTAWKISPGGAEVCSPLLEHGVAWGFVAAKRRGQKPCWTDLKPGPCFCALPSLESRDSCVDRPALACVVMRHTWPEAPHAPQG